MSPRRPGQPPLNRERIVKAAVLVADRGGVGAVSMRRVAEVLGVEAMALYHHLPNKNALMEELVDAVFAEIEAPDVGDDWRTALEGRCASMRRALCRHSWILGLIESRDHVGAHRLHHHNAVLGIAIDAGLSPVDAVLAVSVLDSYVYGFVLQEKQHKLSAPTEVQEMASQFVDRPPVGDLPYLRAVAEAASAASVPSHDETFTHGLRLIIASLHPGTDALAMTKDAWRGDRSSASSCEPTHVARICRSDLGP